MAPTLQYFIVAAVVYGKERRLSTSARHSKGSYLVKILRQVLGESSRGRGRQLGRLDDGAVAGGDRPDERDDDEVDGEVPRADDEDDAVRLRVVVDRVHHSQEVLLGVRRVHPRVELEQRRRDRVDAHFHFRQHCLAVTLRMGSQRARETFEISSKSLI